MRIPRPVRPLVAFVVLGAGASTACSDGGSADPASIERLNALDARIEALEERVAELQDDADATDPGAEADADG